MDLSDLADLLQLANETTASKKFKENMKAAGNDVLSKYKQHLKKKKSHNPNAGNNSKLLKIEKQRLTHDKFYRLFYDFHYRDATPTDKMKDAEFVNEINLRHNQQKELIKQIQNETQKQQNIHRQQSPAPQTQTISRKQSFSKHSNRSHSPSIPTNNTQNLLKSNKENTIKYVNCHITYVISKKDVMHPLGFLFSFVKNPVFCFVLFPFGFQKKNRNCLFFFCLLQSTKIRKFAK